MRLDNTIPHLSYDKATGRVDFAGRLTSVKRETESFDLPVTLKQQAREFRLTPCPNGACHISYKEGVRRGVHFAAPERWLRRAAE